MATCILSFLVDPGLLKDRSFSYQGAYLKVKEDPFHYKPIYSKGQKLKKVYIYFLDPATASWRWGEEPHHVRGFLGFMVLGTVVVFLAVQVFRAIQLGLSLFKLAFTCYKKSYPSREKENFLDIFFNTTRLEIEAQREELLFFPKNFISDVKIFLSMFIAALAGSFSRDMNQVLKMQIVFSEMEKKWNRGRNFDRKDGAQGDWHSENTILSHLIFQVKKSSSRKDDLIEATIDFLQEARGANRGFYLFPCAQPVSEAFLERIEWIPEKFPSYEAVYDSYRKQFKTWTKIAGAQKSSSFAET